MAYLTEPRGRRGPGPRLFEERRRELGGFLCRIEGTVTPLEAADSRLERLRPVVANEVARLREQLDTLPDAADPPWADLARLERLTQRLAAETLAVVGGISLRASGLDGDAGDLAEALLARVAGAMALGYTFITVPSGSEFIDLMSDVIRVRYPGTGVWDLPVVLARVRAFPREPPAPVGGALRLGGRRAGAGHARETRLLRRRTVGRLFAAYVGGPAYACSALVRFDPARAAEDAPPHHPSAVKRAAAVFATLGRSEAAWQRRQRFAGSLAEPIQSGPPLWQGQAGRRGRHGRAG